MLARVATLAGLDDKHRCASESSVNYGVVLPTRPPRFSWGSASQPMETTVTVGSRKAPTWFSFKTVSQGHLGGS